ncbi:MAG: single-stranded DNA-binding protein [Clostridiales bacterium]|nr:single-stranded DNA-binding protein [Clostridiales bacterium]
MNNLTEKNNKVFISGEIVTEAEFSHEVYGEGFYEMSVLVKRLSGQGDILPVTVSERLIQDKDLKVGSVINAVGQFRSYNKLVDGKSKLMLTVFVRELVDYCTAKNPNTIVLSGYVCKPPVYRTTPFNREIADILIAVNRSYNKSDYIPCIAWGRNARFAKGLEVGEKIAIAGRIQSREYQKKFSDFDVKIMTAYEVSISKLSAYENAENFDVDAEFDNLSYMFEANERGENVYKN